MADNYLEKKYEEWKNGKPVVRRTVPSLETLLKRLGDPSGPDPDYQVKQAQLDAIVRAASLVGPDMKFSSSEADSIVSVTGDDPVLLGEAVLAIRLKAAELRLNAEICASGEESITLRITKGL